ncbi:MAG: DNA recombination protein RmuC, partial [Candidatus Kerfeldbacteria bacterium CG08_land_8_20_14_0_20_42_7]
MEIVIIVIGCALVLGIGVLLFRQRGPSDTNRMSENLVRLEERLQQLNERNSDLTKTLDTKLSESTKMMQSQFGESAKIVRDVTERLTKLDETNRQVVDFADQLQNLQDILKNPKQRGVLGEYYLEETLKNVLPPNSYKMQYKFKDGEIVDAVVFVKEKIIPVDSKFTLENYERLLTEKDSGLREQYEKQFTSDLKTRIDETAKYVRPNEKTMDFAFMFIPSEAIYYDLLVNKIGAGKVATRDLIEYAFKDKHVIIVSPTS